jgi:hypothetical protein
MAGVVASRAFPSWTLLCADWCAARRRAQDAEWGRPVRFGGNLRYHRQIGARVTRGPIRPEADWGGDVQSGGVVMIYGGSITFKGGSIARSEAVRNPRCRQLCVLHGFAWGAMYVAWCVVHVATCAAHDACMVDVT